MDLLPVHPDCTSEVMPRWATASSSETSGEGKETQRQLEQDELGEQEGVEQRQQQHLRVDPKLSEGCTTSLQSTLKPQFTDSPRVPWVLLVASIDS